MPAQTQFITMTENGPTGEEVVVYHLQWTGNEQKLTLLQYLINKCDYVHFGNNQFYLSINSMISEELVDWYYSDDNVSNKKYIKCTGNFNYEMVDLLKGLNMDESELVGLLFDILADEKIKEMFV